ncbi:hypothetical protein SDC9_143077 [bioreactor metagenome]|uniref:Uncharacterized protein n=1 Tax=bioreactor metagenome TaxID=1076179 RepID=A0A645E2Y4_9ZZZZ
MGAQLLVQFLTVAALFNRLHHDVLSRHKRQLSHHPGFDNLRVNHQPVTDVEHNLQNRIHCQKCLADSDALVGRIVKRALKPLYRCSQRRVCAVGNHIACQRADAFRTHGVALVGHGGRTDLLLFKRLFHFFKALQQAHVVGEL